MTAALTIAGSNPASTSEDTIMLKAVCHSATQRILRPVVRYTCANTKAPQTSVNSHPIKTGHANDAMPVLSQNRGRQDDGHDHICQRPLLGQSGEVGGGATGLHMLTAREQDKPVPSGKRQRQ